MAQIVKDQAEDSISTVSKSTEPTSGKKQSFPLTVDRIMEGIEKFERLVIRFTITVGLVVFCLRAFWDAIKHFFQ
jgi:hypothetical protein